eukprot:421722-Prymnesium_polylepis.2
MQSSATSLSQCTCPLSFPYCTAGREIADAMLQPRRTRPQASVVACVPSHYVAPPSPPRPPGAPATPPGSPPSPPSLTVSSGPCTVSGLCVRSPNYPSTHGNNEACAWVKIISSEISTP